MRIVWSCLLSVLILSLSCECRAQIPDGELYQDSKGRYLFTHSLSAPGVPKALLYERLKPFVVEDLNASDTRINWDDAGQDSITTIAYIELGNGPEMINQLVDCKARLDFTEGQVTLRLSSFNYSGKRVDNDLSYARALHRLSPITYSAQTYALTLLAETLRQLMAKMDAVAIGEVASPEEPKGRRR